METQHLTVSNYYYKEAYRKVKEAVKSDDWLLTFYNLVGFFVENGINPDVALSLIYEIEVQFKALAAEKKKTTSEDIDKLALILAHCLERNTVRNSQ